MTKRQSILELCRNSVAAERGPLKDLILNMCKVIESQQLEINKLKKQLTTVQEKMMTTLESKFSDYVNEGISSSKSATLDQELFALQERITKVESDLGDVPGVMELFDQHQDLDVPELMKTIVRNTRRMDAVDQHVSDVRNECVNVASAMSDVHCAVQQFSHRIHDWEVFIEENHEATDDAFKRVKEVICELAKTIGIMLSSMCDIGQMVGDTASFLQSQTTKGTSRRRFVDGFNCQVNAIPASRSFANRNYRSAKVVQR